MSEPTYIERPLMSARRHAINERSSTHRGRDLKARMGLGGSPSKIKLL